MFLNASCALRTLIRGESEHTVVCLLSPFVVLSSIYTLFTYLHTYLHTHGWLGGVMVRTLDL